MYSSFMSAPTGIICFCAKNTSVAEHSLKNYKNKHFNKQQHMAYYFISHTFLFMSETNQYFSNNMEVTIADKPKMAHRKPNNILISWENVYENIPEKSKFRLQKFTKINGWTTVYWGSKKLYNITGVPSCTCYNFRLKLTSETQETDWIEFKAATDEHPPTPKDISRAVKFAKTSLLRKLINKKPKLLEMEGVDCKTPLMQACEKGDLLIVTFLINLGAKVNKSTLGTKRTALMVALYNGHLATASMLLDKGAKKETTDINGLSALHHAIDSNCFDSVEFALERGFDVNVKDTKGWTPLLRAVVLNCQDSIIELLIKSGADVHIVDKNGFNFEQHCKLANKNFDHFKELIAK